MKECKTWLPTTLMILSSWTDGLKTSSAKMQLMAQSLGCSRTWCSAPAAQGPCAWGPRARCTPYQGSFSATAHVPIWNIIIITFFYWLFSKHTNLGTTSQRRSTWPDCPPPWWSCPAGQTSLKKVSWGPVQTRCSPQWPSVLSASNTCPFSHLLSMMLYGFPSIFK